MNQSKLIKQFKEVIDQSSKNIGKCVCLEISNNSALLRGVSKKTLNLQTAIVLIQHNKKTYVKGCFDEVYFNSSSIESLNTSNSILLGIDCRNEKKNTIYYSSGGTMGKVSSNSNINSDDVMYIFWEYGKSACLTLCAYDKIRDEVIREVVSASNEPMTKFLRAIVRQVLTSHKEDHENLLTMEDNENLLHRENDWEEEPDYEEESNWEDRC